MLRGGAMSFLTLCDSHTPGRTQPAARFVLALALAASVTPQVAAQTTTRWATGVSDNWTQTAPVRWDNGIPNNGVPPGSTYNAFIDVAGTYTVTLNSPVTVSNLTINNATATLAVTSGGTLTVVNNATLTAGVLQLTGGTLSGGSYSSNGGVIRPNGNSNNILSNVMLGSAGVLDLSQASSFVRLEGTTALPAGGYTIGGSSTLVFNQPATLTGVALTLGGNVASIFADGGNTVTIGPTSSVTVGTAAVSNTLGVNRLAATAATVLANLGTVGFAAGATNGTLNITSNQGNGAFQNGGTVSANAAGSTVTISLPLTNLPGGQVVAPTGGTVNLNGGFTNQGTFVVSAAS